MSARTSSFLFAVAAALMAAAAGQEYEYPVDSAGQCGVPGACGDGAYIGLVPGDVVTENDCLFGCQETDGCQTWQYVPGNEDCFMYSTTCSIQDPETITNCDGCTVGDVDCDPVYQCDLDGTCIGTNIERLIGGVASADACLQECKDFYAEGGDCEWYSYNPEDEYCYLWGSCPDMSDTGCPAVEGCTTGERSCELTSVDILYGKIMLFGGITENGNEAEVLDVQDRYPSCAKPAEIYQGGDILIYGPSAGFVGGRVLMCGGSDFNTNQQLRSCYSFAMDDTNDDTPNDGDGGKGKWTLEDNLQLRIARYDAGAVEMDHETLWITGGIGTSGTLDSTEIYSYTETGSGTVIESIEDGPDLPRKSYGHCMIKINDSQAVMVGGSPYDNRVHLYDFDTDEWTDLAPMPDSVRSAYCGLISEADGSDPRIVVAAGSNGRYSDLTFIYSIDDDEWATDGPEHPDVPIFQGISIPYQNTFITADGDTSTGKVYIYDVERNRFDQIGTAAPTHNLGAGVLIEDAFYPFCQGE